MADIYAGGVPASRLIRQWADAGDLQAATSRGIVAAAIHAACFLCDRAIAAGIMTPGDALGDRGLVHELAHAAAGDATRDVAMLETFARRAEALEAAV